GIALLHFIDQALTKLDLGCVRAATGEARYGEALGPILRLSRKPDYSPVRIDFEPGDRFILYSDVFCEDVGGAAHTFSSGDLLGAVGAISRRSRREVFAQRLTEALAQRVGRPFPDDLTVVGLQFHDVAEAVVE
ncbi:MAG: SpoIIE family protein phosphatase, partial [Pseudomonadota bacterium]